MSIATTAFHPDHLVDLARSGLTEDDARAADLHSARPGDIVRLIGRDVPDGTSALVFPYSDCNGFTRLKLFPPLLDRDGKPQRYLQRAGTGCRLYVPPLVAPVLTDPVHPLAITEGEKKALAVTKAGWPCVGIGGLWNFITDGELIADLKAIPWRQRIVRLIPDADVWQREDLLPAVYRLGRLLEAEGATVLIVRLSSLPEIKKTGADDYLVANGPAAFRKLIEKAATLGQPAFRALRQQEKHATGKTAYAKLPTELVERRIHPALHLGDDFAAVGVREHSDGGIVCKVLTSERRVYLAEEIAAALTARPFAYADLVNRWCPEHIARFLAGEDHPPTFAETLAKTVDLIDKHLELGRDSEIALLATWGVGTYFYPSFATFPRLDLRGERGSGKSKALQLLAAISFNGLLRVSPTPAVLFRLAESLRPTLCLDEIEGLAGDDKREILATLNAGYKAGGRVDRCEGDDRLVKSYSVYCPVALAGIAGLNRVTEDRAITIVLTKGTDPAKLNAEVNAEDSRFGELRDLCYRLALLRWREVVEAYRVFAIPSWLMGRERELWLPLLSVASLADAEGGLGLVEDLLSLAKEQREDRAGLSDEAEALLEVLEHRLNGQHEILCHPKDLCEDLGKQLRWDKPPRPETVGRWLRRLKLPKAPRSAEGIRYQVSKDMLDDIHSRWGTGGGEPTLPANLHFPTN